jgi:hypothetical protein
MCEGRKHRLAACAVLIVLLPRAGIEEAVAPLPVLAHRFFPTASACRSDRRALTARCDLVLMPLRLSQSNGHGNCKQRYSANPQHGFLLPRLGEDTLFEPT